MKRFLITLPMLCVMLCGVASAANGDTYNVKYGATDTVAVYDAISEMEFPEGAWSHTTAPSNFWKDTTVTVSCAGEARTVNIHVVSPTFAAQEIPSIDADSEHNVNKNTLITYAYQYRELTQTNTAYEQAMGTSPAFELGKYSITSYVAKGTTYVLSQYYMGQEVKQTLTVNGVTNFSPWISIDNTGKLYCSPDVVEYSVDKKSWITIKKGATIPSTYYGKTLYFRTPASSYAEASDYVFEDIKESRETPTVKPKLSSTSFSVKVENASEFNGCEFSIDGTTYSSSTEWSNLQADTRYTVYVRYKTTAYYFASAPTSATINTKEAPKNLITWEKSLTSGATHFLVTGTTKLKLSSNTLSAEYLSSLTSDLKKEITTASKHSNVVTVFDVTMEQEEGDTREFNSIKFTMPSGLGKVQLRLTTPYCTIITEDSSTSVEIASVRTTAQIWGLKDFVKDKDIVYKVTTKGDGEIQIFYPWEFTERADLSGLQVTYVNTTYKEQTELTYQQVPGGIIFTMPGDGYFAIVNLHKDYGALDFTDCQSHWAYSYIHWAYSMGIVNGISEFEFSPNTLVNRAQIAVLLARMAGADPSIEYTTPYTDVEEGSWYSWAVGYLYELGALKDMGDGLFGPFESITREQMAALVAKVFPSDDTIWRPMDCGDRDTISTYALNAVDSLYNRNVFYGDTDGNFNPLGNLTRAELVTILYRLAKS